jgi:hypothetical protein
MFIVGAGMAGLLAAAMIREPLGLEIFESQASLPHNHNSLLRFRSSIVADALGIPFKEVRVIKSIEGSRNPAADANSYAFKVTGQASARSILSAQGASETRFIAPPDLIQRMADVTRGSIRFGTSFPFRPQRWMRPVISTVPMPTLMDKLGWPKKSEFRWRSGVNIVAELEPKMVNAYCSVYTPDPRYKFARVSLTGNVLIAECYGPEGSPPVVELSDCLLALDVLGLPFDALGDWSVRRQQYAKILPIDEDERRSFIMWASREFGIYSLGRFATWRPGLMLDDVVNDVRVIQRLSASSGELYNHLKKRA